MASKQEGSDGHQAHLGHSDIIPFSQVPTEEHNVSETFTCCSTEQFNTPSDIGCLSAMVIKYVKETSWCCSFYLVIVFGVGFRQKKTSFPDPRYRSTLVYSASLWRPCAWADPSPKNAWKGFSELKQLEELEILLLTVGEWSGDSTSVAFATFSFWMDVRSCSIKCWSFQKESTGWLVFVMVRVYVCVCMGLVKCKGRFYCMLYVWSIINPPAEEHMDPENHWLVLVIENSRYRGPFSWPVLP